MVSMAIAIAGTITAGAPWRALRGSRAPASPNRHGRLNAESEEGQAAQQQDDEDEAQAEIGQHRQHHVRQDFFHHNCQVVFAARPRPVTKSGALMFTAIDRTMRKQPGV